jgi:hypothetical protein
MLFAQIIRRKLRMNVSKYVYSANGEEGEKLCLQQEGD